MKIFVNGKETEFNDDVITYEQICDLANQPQWSSVTFETSSKCIPRSGLLYRGKSTWVQEDMRFECIVTGDA